MPVKIAAMEASCQTGGPLTTHREISGAKASKVANVIVAAVDSLRSPQKATHKAIPKPPIAPQRSGKCTRLGHARVPTLKDDPSLAPFEAQGRQGKRVGTRSRSKRKSPGLVQVRRAPGLEGVDRLLRISSRKQVPSFGNLRDRIGRKIHSSSIQLNRVRRALRTPRFDSRSCRVDLLSPQNLGLWLEKCDEHAPSGIRGRRRPIEKFDSDDRQKKNASGDGHAHTDCSNFAAEVGVTESGSNR